MGHERGERAWGADTDREASLEGQEGFLEEGPSKGDLRARRELTLSISEEREGRGDMSVFSWERVQQEHVWKCDRIRCRWCPLSKATRGTLGLNNRAYCWLQHWRTHALGTRGVSPHRVLDRADCGTQACVR